MKRNGKRLLCLALAGILCWMVSAQALAEAKLPEGMVQAEAAQQAEPGYTEDDGTVSGSDINSGSRLLTDGGLEELTESEDISSLLYQEGGTGAPAGGEYGIAAYALSERENLKEAVLNALKAGEASLDVSAYAIPAEDRGEAGVLFSEVINENPELFYVNGWVGYRYSGTLLELTFSYKPVTEEQKSAYAAKVNEAVSLVTGEMSNVEKALVLHDYLAQHCAYAKAELDAGTLASCPNVYDAYGALVNGKAVCQGYALAYVDLLKRVGIASYLCSSDSMDHAWNVVLIDGEWYHVDVTWDDPTWNTEGRVRHKYFLLSDTEMRNREHEGWAANVVCSSTAYDSQSYWWYSVDSQIVQVGSGDYVYIRNKGTINSENFDIVRKTGGAAEQVLYSSSAIWTSNGGACGLHRHFCPGRVTIYISMRIQSCIP